MADVARPGVRAACGSSRRRGFCRGCPGVAATHCHSSDSFLHPFPCHPSAAQCAEILEVQLYVSRDRGAKWRFYSRTEPQQGAFAFQTTGDGEYWFFIRTVDRLGQVQPQTVGEPGLRVVVDTVPPKLRLEAQRGDLGQIVVRWTIEEPNLKAGGLRIQCRAAANQPWQLVPMDSAATTGSTVRSGEAQWWPPADYERIEIRGEAADAAGNTAVEHAEVAAKPKPLPVAAAQPGPPKGNSTALHEPKKAVAGGATAEASPGSSSSFPDSSVAMPQEQPGWQACAGTAVDSVAQRARRQSGILEKVDDAADDSCRPAGRRGAAAWFGRFCGAALPGRFAVTGQRLAFRPGIQCAPACRRAIDREFESGSARLRAGWDTGSDGRLHPRLGGDTDSLCRGQQSDSAHR